MTVGGVGGQNFSNKIHRQRKNDTQNEMQPGEAFAKNLQEKDYYAKEQTTEKKTENVSSVNTSTYSNSLQTTMILHDSGRVQLQAVVECTAKHITYAESDNVKVCIEEGYTFKAKVYADRHKVYIEKKTDSGEILGYEVKPLELEEDTTDPLEQMALESWEMARRGFMGDAPFHEIDSKEEIKRLMGEEIEEAVKEADYTDMSIEEAMQKFYTYIEERIMHGDEEYKIGSASMSIKEWNRLLERIDDEIDVTKEQLARLFEDTDEALEDFALTEKVSEEEVLYRKNIFDRIENGKTAPYMSLADENGCIEYKGVVFQCDTKVNAICLGDCSPKANYLVISLPDGGVLKVNRDNIDELMSVITMFSPKDQEAIVRAVSTDSYCERVKNEIEKEGNLIN